MAEPRYATEEWRWVTSEDGLRKELVAGPEPLPVPRVVLRCRNIDVEDAAGIGVLPKLYGMLLRFDRLANDRYATSAEWALFHRDVLAVLAAARGEGVPDAET